MKTAKLLVLLCLCTFQGYGQNWYPINAEETFYYISGVGEWIGIHIDSTAVVGSQTVYYPGRIAALNAETESTGYDCPSEILSGILQAGFLLGEVVQIEDGGFLFQHPDTFLIYPLAGLGEAWIFSALFGQDPVTAEVVGLEQMEVLGAIDSVKTIALSDGRMIQLSKDHGIVSFESFDGEVFVLEGIPDRQLGNYPIGRYEVFDFEVGDVFVYIENDSPTSEQYSSALTRIEIIGIDDGDNGQIEYTYDKTSYWRSWQLFGSSGMYTIGELPHQSYQGEYNVQLNLNEPHLSDAVPGNYYFSLEEGVENGVLWLYSDVGWFANHRTVQMETLNNRQSKVFGGSLAFSPALVSIAENFAESASYNITDPEMLFQGYDIYLPNPVPSFDIGDSVSVSFNLMECNTTVGTAYAEGLGIVSTEVSTGLNYSRAAMVGYRKGTEEYGHVPSQVELISMGTSAAEALPQVRVYPVPTAEQLFLSHHEGQAFRIFDISGKPVLQGALYATVAIDVSSLAAGMYTGQILGNGAPVGRFRFVKTM